MWYYLRTYVKIIKININNKKYTAQIQNKNNKIYKKRIIKLSIIIVNQK